MIHGTGVTLGQAKNQTSWRVAIHNQNAYDSLILDDDMK